VRLQNFTVKQLQQKHRTRYTLFVLLLGGCQTGDQTWIYKHNAQRMATPESGMNDRLWGRLDTMPKIYHKALLSRRTFATAVQHV
jgi:hypothetical protein